MKKGQQPKWFALGISTPDENYDGDNIQASEWYGPMSLEDAQYLCEKIRELAGHDVATTLIRLKSAHWREVVVRAQILAKEFLADQ